MQLRQNAQRLIEFQEFQQPSYLNSVAPVAQLPRRAQGLSQVQKVTTVFVALALIFCAAQLVRCAITSGIKLGTLLSQLSVVETAHHNATARNTSLQDNIVRYSSPLGVEEMARERLSMVGQDEVLVRVYPVSVASATP